MSNNCPKTEVLRQLTASLTLEEKVAILTGRDFWNTVPIERIGLRNMLMSDGPAGVRGERWDEREPSLNLPSGSALGASWSRDIATKYGHALAAEAQRKGVIAVLGPTINLHRTPYGGRHFECKSEDAVLSGELAAAYVQGLQANGVAATPKHYVANDFETDRFTVDVRVGERALRELYLRPFEDAIVRGGAWTIMSSYNKINGVTATENDLLETPLRDEWGFDGVVISDWTAVRSLHSASKEQDLVMPGPVGPWGDALVAAVRTGEIDESTIDRKVERLLRLATRVGALHIDGATVPTADRIAAPGDATSVDGLAFAHEAAIAGMVLLRNEGILPLDASRVSSVAVIGHNATLARTQGGGSATVLPESVVSPLDGLVAAFGASKVRHAVGAIVQEGIVGLPVETMTNPVTGGPGVRATFVGADGSELFVEDRRATSLIYFGGDAPITASSQLVLHTKYTPGFDGVVRLGFAGINPTRIEVDGRELVSGHLMKAGMDLGAAFLTPPTLSAPVTVTADQTLDVVVSVTMANGDSPLAGALSFTFGIEPDNTPAELLIAEAVAAAKDAEVAIVVVGTNSRVESEGYDRTSLALPGHQDELVRAVAAVNRNTIVVVNAGSPVLMPWRNDVAAVLLTFFPGQAFGAALSDVLLGIHEPGGRLPTTWPAVETDIPVGLVELTDGAIDYSEGIHIGYRAWLRSGATPAYVFGSGFGYTSWTLDGASVPATVAAGDDTSVLVKVANSGARRGRQVVQVYAERAESNVERPARWLAGFADITLDAGASGEIHVPVRARELAHYDGGWQWEPGRFTLSVGFDVANTPVQLDVDVK